MKTSAGVLLFKKENDKLKFFLVHAGGPFFAKKDEGFWGIPKGLIEEGEDMKAAAIREVSEELGIDIGIDTEKLIDLESVKLKSGKVIYAYAFEANFGDIETQSNTIFIKYPPKSGKQLEIPEVDKGFWFETDIAKQKINQRQKDFIDRLLKKVA